MADRRGRVRGAIRRQPTPRCALATHGLPPLLDPLDPPLQRGQRAVAIEVALDEGGEMALHGALFGGERVALRERLREVAADRFQRPLHQFVGDLGLGLRYQ